MKLNKILSSALAFVLLFSSIVAVIPFASFAAEEDEPIVSVLPSDSAEQLAYQLYEKDGILGILDEYTKYGSTYTGGIVFDTAEDMFNHEFGKGYLDSIKYAGYSLYINRYTGVVYYVNDVTNQIITSNPIDASYLAQTENTPIHHTVLSQIELEYFQITNANNKGVFNSFDAISNGCFLKVSKSADGKGIVVTYTLADASDELLAPLALLYDDFNDNIIIPAFNKLAELMTQYCGEENPDFNILNNSTKILNSYGVYNTIRVNREINNLKSYAEEKLGKNSPEYKIINTFATNLYQVFNEYEIYNPDALKAQGNTENGKSFYEVMSEKYPPLKEGKSIAYLKNGNKAANLILVDRYIRGLDIGYTIEKLEADEAASGYVSDDSAVMARFRCSLEYKIDETGELIVSLSAPTELKDDPTADDIFAVRSVSPLKYFGAGDMDKDGYIFFPDGSGAVVEFEDFYVGADSGQTSKNPLAVSANVYGEDYCYGKITGAHREQVTMPVYGMVSTARANESSTYADGSNVKNGFFAILEEGEALSKIEYASAPENHKYAYVYSAISFALFDEINLAQSLSVSNLGVYLMMAEGKYEGKLTTRYVMLTDNAVGDAAHAADALDSYYPASYVGMALYYRNYLEKNGVISALDKTDADLPLYIEVLGSIDVVKKILSFPVTVSTPLTTFEDVETMYEELSDAKTKINEKIAYYENLANNEEDDEVKAAYLVLVNKYKDIASKIQAITNVNFRLTGFANGGMYYTYPAKLKWEKSVGGKRGFKNIVAASAKYMFDQDDTTNFGVYPDFDFMYIANTASFDGVSKDRHASKMVDNRYASKQVYSSISQKFEKLFSLLTSADALASLYGKFDKKYSKFNHQYISVSTMGSDLNSNFNSDNIVDRQSSKNYVSSLLERIAVTDEYSVMVDAGNMYAVKYADHILNVATDSSHLRHSSYTVPFIGMVLHGYVNYAGSALNYSGSPEYDILRAIENGASIYYILCSQNSNYLKEDEQLSSYFGIDYENWFEKIVVQYAKLNGAIGDYQSYKINDHKVIIGERIIDDAEMEMNFKNLALEYVENIDRVISNAIDAKRKAVGNGKIYLNVDTESLNAKLLSILGITSLDSASEFEQAAYEECYEMLSDLLADYAKYYGDSSVDASHTVSIAADDIVYESVYSYTTTSLATDGDNYVYTDYSCDNGNVVMVTYEKGNKTVKFILNYNNFDIEVRLDANSKPEVIKANDFKKI